MHGVIFVEFSVIFSKKLHSFEVYTTPSLFSQAVQAKGKLSSCSEKKKLFCLFSVAEFSLPRHQRPYMTSTFWSLVFF
jgi:hypothetical protein